MNDSFAKEVSIVGGDLFTTVISPRKFYCDEGPTLNGYNRITIHTTSFMRMGFFGRSIEIKTNYWIGNYRLGEESIPNANMVTIHLDKSERVKVNLEKIINEEPVNIPNGDPLSKIKVIRD